MQCGGSLIDSSRVNVQSLCLQESDEESAEQDAQVPEGTAPVTEADAPDLAPAAERAGAKQAGTNRAAAKVCCASLHAPMGPCILPAGLLIVPAHALGFYEKRGQRQAPHIRLRMHAHLDDRLNVLACIL